MSEERSNTPGDNKINENPDVWQFISDNWDSIALEPEGISPDHVDPEDEQKELERIAKNNRNKHKNRMFVWTMWILWFLVVIVLMVRIVHLILPSYCNWLTPEQLSGLDKTFFSGAIGGAIAKYGQKVFQ